MGQAIPATFCRAFLFYCFLKESWGEWQLSLSERRVTTLRIIRRLAGLPISLEDRAFGGTGRRFLVSVFLERRTRGDFLVIHLPESSRRAYGFISRDMGEEKRSVLAALENKYIRDKETKVFIVNPIRDRMYPVLVANVQ